MSKSIAQVLEKQINPSPNTTTGITVTVLSGRLSALKSGNFTADDTEQTLLEFMDIGRVVGYVDLGNMQAGDIIIIRQYMKIIDGGNYRKYAEETYTGLQSPPILYITPKETDFAIKITLQQVAGSYRTYPYNFLREI